MEKQGQLGYRQILAQGPFAEKGDMSLTKKPKQGSYMMGGTMTNQTPQMIHGRMVKNTT